MFKNYLKIAFRILFKKKAYSFINIAGLAVGMACCILIMLWVQSELGYDNFHENGDRIYRLCMDATLGGAELSAPFSNCPSAPALIRDYPEVVNAVRLSGDEKILVRYQDKQIYEENSAYADNSFFEIFTFPFTAGDPRTALSTAYSVVMSQSQSEKYFGDTDPIGKSLRINDEHDYTVTGVFQDFPENSHLTLDIILSFETFLVENPEIMDRWINFNYLTYLMLESPDAAQALESKLPEFIERYMGDDLRSIGGTINYLIQPLTEIHLHPVFDYEYAVVGDIAYVYLFSAIAFLVLLIACFNFINISTARAASRAKEVGMRKVCGAARWKLITQFLGESILACLLALMMALLLVELAHTLFNSIAGRELSFSFLLQPLTIGLLVLLAIVVGAAAGCFPAFYLSAFRPSAVLKSKLKTGHSGLRLRNVLVVAQFVVSIALIIGALAINNQVNYMKKVKLGFDKEQVLAIPEPGNATDVSIELLKKELGRVRNVAGVSMSSGVPGWSLNKSAFVPEGYTMEQAQLMDQIHVDHDFVSTLGIQLAAGRDFSEDFPSDSSESLLINETAARKFGWDNPIGMTIGNPNRSQNDGEEITYKTVVGVVKDFHMNSLHYKIEPAIIGYMSGDMDNLLIRLSTNDISSTISSLKQKWAEVTGGKPMDYFFLDQNFNSLYQNEERVGKLSLYFCLLAVIITCLGLFGLSTYIVESRTKEIGVRKVLGASIPGIVRLISKDFLIMVALSNALAWPIAYLAVNHWLQDFAYRVNLGVGTMILAAAIALLIALITVSVQAVKAARTNPIESLRYE
jgi:putative ABC transport system permease protein